MAGAHQRQRLWCAVACIAAVLMVVTRQPVDALVQGSGRWNNDINTYYQISEPGYADLSYVHAFVNTDLNGATGYADSKFSSGADMLVECPFNPFSGSCSVYSYSGAPGSTAWSWAWVGPATASVTVAGLITITVPRTTLGETQPCIESSTLVFHTQFRNFTEDFGPSIDHTYAPLSTCTTPAAPPTCAALPLRNGNRANVNFGMVYAGNLTAQTKTIYIDSVPGGTVVAGGTGSIAADFRLDGNLLYSWSGTAWVLVSPQPTGIGFSDSTGRRSVSWTVPRSAIGDAGLCSNSYSVVYQAGAAATASAPFVVNIPGLTRPAVPAYIYPYPSTTTYNAAANNFTPPDTQTAYYATLFSKMSSTTHIAVLNPANGPLKPNNPANTDLYLRYINVITQMKTAYPTKARFLMYIATGNGARPLADVQADVNATYNYYNNFSNPNIRVDGVFLDEGAVTLCQGNLNYYTSIVTYIRQVASASAIARGIPDVPAFVVLNPGVPLPECYIQNTGLNVIVTREETQASYIANSIDSLGWGHRYPTDRIWHLIHTTTASTTANFQSVVTTAKNRGAGWVFVTNDSINTNPWDSMPSQSLWNAEHTTMIGSTCTAS